MAPFSFDVCFRLRMGGGGGLVLCILLLRHIVLEHVFPLKIKIYILITTLQGIEEVQREVDSRQKLTHRSK
jgi:hypothetical protein